MRAMVVRLAAFFLLFPGAFFVWGSTPVFVEDQAWIDLSEPESSGDAIPYFFHYQGLLLQSQEWNATFTGGSREFHFNSVRMFFGAPVRSANGRFYVSEGDFEGILAPLLGEARGLSHSLSSLRVIALDAGHGGKDEGGASILPGVREKDVVLEITLVLKALLEKAGFRVVMTRRTDDFIPLADRTRRANVERADLFISIHLNAARSSAALGTETFVLTPRGSMSTSQREAADGDQVSYPGNDFDSLNSLLGFVVQDQLLKDLKSVDRGVKRARFQVLREARSPAVLVEAGFLTHPTEAELLASADYQELIARSLVRAVMRYALLIETMADR